MSTRCVTKFFDDGSHLTAIVYRHSDGYPEEAGLDLREFLWRTKTLRGSGNAAYLAAKYVVFLADMFNVHYTPCGSMKANDILDFMSVGVMMDVPFDVEYIYHVYCERTPTMKIFHAENGVETEEVEIW